MSDGLKCVSQKKSKCWLSSLFLFVLFCLIEAKSTFNLFDFHPFRDTKGGAESRWSKSGWIFQRLADVSRRYKDEVDTQDGRHSETLSPLQRREELHSSCSHFSAPWWARGPSSSPSPAAAPSCWARALRTPLWRRAPRTSPWRPSRRKTWWDIWEEQWWEKLWYFVSRKPGFIINTNNKILHRSFTCL